MKYFFTLLMVAFSFASCSNDEATSDDDPFVQQEYTDLKIYGNSKIVVPVNSAFFVTTIDSGNKLVFEYSYLVESDPEFQDSGYYESIVFEIEPGVSEFSVEDGELRFVNAYYRQVCFCLNTESIEIVNGKISGTKINATDWSVIIDVDFLLMEGQDLESKEIAGTFVLN